LSGLSTQQLSERRHSDNPILQIEELRRFPLRGARVPAGGTALVFRSPAGRLSSPSGGYTAGEMLWRGPHVVYRVDLAAHPVFLEWDLAGSSGRDRITVTVTAHWTVTDPVAVVAQRVSDVPVVCLTALQAALGDVPRPSRSELSLVQFALRSRLRDSVDLPEGIRLDRIRLNLRRRPAQDASGLVKELLAVEDEAADASAEALRESWLADQELARSGLAALDDGAWAEADGSRIRAAKQALERFAELTDRIFEHLPGPAGPSSPADQRPESGGDGDR
jgi:hypothetical protein